MIFANLIKPRKCSKWLWNISLEETFVVIQFSIIFKLSVCLSIFLNFNSYYCLNEAKQKCTEITTSLRVMRTRKKAQENGMKWKICIRAKFYVSIKVFVLIQLSCQIFCVVILIFVQQKAFSGETKRSIKVSRVFRLWKHFERLKFWQKIWHEWKEFGYFWFICRRSS